MRNPRSVRAVLLFSGIALIAMSVYAEKPIGPVGDTSRGSIPVTALSGPLAGSGVANAQCHHWKLGDDSQSGTTWVSSSNAYLYTGAGLQFTPNKFTGPEDFTPGPDLAGVIGVGIANPNFIPRSIDVFYSFLPVSRASSATLQPPPTTVGLTWFNSYEAGNRNRAFEDTVLIYPAYGLLNYTGFFPRLNPNTRYLVFVQTGDNGNGASGRDRGFAAAGVICFNR